MFNNNRDGSVDIAMETIDSPRALVESIKEFGKAMRVCNFKYGKFDIENPQILKAIKMAGLKVNTQSTSDSKEDGDTSLKFGIVEF